MMPDKKKISILGCGWFGLALAKNFVSKGFSVKGSTTTIEKLPLLKEAGVESFFVDFSTSNEIFEATFFECNILFICIPPKIRNGNTDDYLTKIKSIIKAIKTYEVKQVLFISSTGVYGDLNTEVTELTEPQPDSESGQAILRAEELLKQESDFTSTIIRFAGLIGPSRDPGRFFAGKQYIPNGKAPVNLIHLEDCIGISNFILANEVYGKTYNAVSPSHPKKSDFYINAALRSGLAAPEFLDELNNWKIVLDTRSNYKYHVNDLTDYKT